MAVPQLIVRPDAAAVARSGADLVLEAALAAVADHGRFTLALTGGSTPEGMYQLLATPEFADRVPWQQTHFFMGDERFVPAAAPESNYGMARRTLLDHVKAAHVYPVPTDGPGVAAAASAYAKTLADVFATPPDGPPPRFDLILLGLGDDGHCASLFPGAAAVRESKLWVTASPPGTLPPPVDRVTFTLPVLNAAHKVLFLVAGANKAKAVHEVIENHAAIDVHPAAGVRPAGGVTWLLDDDAASRLTRRT